MLNPCLNMHAGARIRSLAIYNACSPTSARGSCVCRESDRAYSDNRCYAASTGADPGEGGPSPRRSRRRVSWHAQGSAVDGPHVRPSVSRNVWGFRRRSLRCWWACRMGADCVYALGSLRSRRSKPRGVAGASAEQPRSPTGDSLCRHQGRPDWTALLCRAGTLA